MIQGLVWLWHLHYMAISREELYYKSWDLGYLGYPTRKRNLIIILFFVRVFGDTCVSDKRMSSLSRITSLTRTFRPNHIRNCFFWTSLIWVCLKMSRWQFQNITCYFPLKWQKSALLVPKPILGPSETLSQLPGIPKALRLYKSATGSP